MFKILHITQPNEIMILVKSQDISIQSIFKYKSWDGFWLLFTPPRKYPLKTFIVSSNFKNDLSQFKIHSYTKKNCLFNKNLNFYVFKKTRIFIVFFRFIANMTNAFTTAFGTGSSSATLPVTIRNTNNQSIIFS